MEKEKKGQVKQPWECMADAFKQVNDLFTPRMNVKEASRFVGISVPTIRTYVSQRKIPFIKIGAKVVFDADDLTAWLNSKKVAVRGKNE